MGKINFLPDFGAPLTVVAVDLVAESFAPTWTKWIDGAMTAGGYLGGYLGFGGDFVKNIGIASLPITARNIYEWARSGIGGTSRRLAFQPAGVSQRVSRIPPTPFEEVGLY